MNELLFVWSAASLPVFVIVYVWTAWSLSAVFKKMGIEGWQAWVPVLNLIVLLRIGRFSPWFVLLLLVPLLGHLALAVLLVWAAYRINRSFGFGAGMTVLAALLPPVWTSLLGWGSARWLGDPARLRDPVAALMPAAAQAQVVSGPVPPAPLPPAPIPPASVLPAPLPPAPIPPAPGVPLAAASAPAPITQVPGAAPAVETTAPPADPRSARSAISAQHTFDEIPDEDIFDVTVMAARKRPTWALVPPVGEPVLITSEVVIIGRRPAFNADYVHAQLVPVADETRTVSKTHARLERTGETWMVIDLDSTNGVILIDHDGRERDAAPGVPTPLTTRFLLGDAPLQIQREGA